MEAKKRLSIEPGSTVGGAIRLSEPTDKLAIAEGIETGLAIHCNMALPVWVAGSAHFLSKMAIPPQVNEVYIFCDNDANHCGQKAANTLAERLTSEGKRVEVFTPPEPGTDWLDILYGGDKQ